MSQDVKYALNQEGEFIIDGYTSAKPFSSFFPGIAGAWGTPMWVFYVNRGQGVCSFGVKNKDQSILEFYPANNSYRLVQLKGFRTFIKVKIGDKVKNYEPFQNGFTDARYNTNRKMVIDSHVLKLEETNHSLGIKVNVKYFTVPNENFAALAREVTIENISKKKMSVDLIDGLPAIMPYGMNSFLMKSMSRTIEAWMEVINLNKNIPYFKLKIDPADRPELEKIISGNFYLAYSEDQKGETFPLQSIVDPHLIFGEENDLRVPTRFFHNKVFTVPSVQKVISKTPCAMSTMKTILQPAQSTKMYSIIGHAKTLGDLNKKAPKLKRKGYFQKKEKENSSIINALKSQIFTMSKYPEFDFYAQQSFLDNLIRGGYPQTVHYGDGKKTVFYLYARKHGDLERDYNYFELLPLKFSQGNGNFRDMCQNRRSDVFFNPDCHDMNVINFYNLIQPNGYNPLVVKSSVFNFKKSALSSFLKKCVKQVSGQELLKKIISTPFILGEVLEYIENHSIKLTCSEKEFVGNILANAACYKVADHGEGFWVDHWTYTLDLLENYLQVYPEKTEDILFNKKCFTFYDTDHFVRPRADKHLLCKDGKIRQFNSVFKVETKEQLINSRKSEKNKVRTKNGKGEVYTTTLLVKMLCLITNKITTLDAFGVGIEMEADKPGWNDSMNGLPGILASSTCQSFELYRVVVFLIDQLKQLTFLDKTKLELPQEIYSFIKNTKQILSEFLLKKTATRDYIYWDKASHTKETYRSKVMFGFSGDERTLTFTQIFDYLSLCKKRLEVGLNKAYDKKQGLVYTYLKNNVTDYKILKEKDENGKLTQKLSERDKLPCVKAVSFKQVPVAHFLEGQVHALKIMKNEIIKNLPAKIRKSKIYDKELDMYKVNESLKNEPLEVGRTRVFNPGWLENESVFLHMEYKYILELLKQGHYEEFYKDFFRALIPFQPPQRYGRSILENSSFIASSAFEDKRLWGNGFVARLSGSTAELVNMWLVMNVGENPFIINKKGELQVQFNPTLHANLFTSKPRKYSIVTMSGRKHEGVLEKNSYAFMFLAEILVTYKNAKRKNTFGDDAVSLRTITFVDAQGKNVTIEGSTIGSPYAEQIRNREIKQINIVLG